VTRPRLLDLFSCAGVAGDGYTAAGFDVVAVDIDAAALRHNPHSPVLRDALDVLQDRAFMAGFDAVHASPPCQAYSVTRHTHDVAHPDLLGPVLDLLRAQPLPWVVENVPGAPMPGALVLCGSEFGLRAWDPATESTVALRRHRLFLSSVDLWGAGGCTCAADRAAGRIAGVYGGGSRDLTHARTVRQGGYTPAPDVARALMGVERPVPWKYLTQAIPPAYTRHVGEALIAHLSAVAA
jgi:DNA (cytosine-5)-methyltransferase 1